MAEDVEVPSRTGNSRKENSKVVKASLRSILQPKHRETLLPAIQELVVDFHQVVTAAYLFAKYILLKEIDTRTTAIYELIEKLFFQECLLAMIDYPQANAKNAFRPLIQQHKTPFLTECYPYYQRPQIKSPSQLCDYEATKMVTAYKNNLQCHLGAHLRKSINLWVGLKEKKKQLVKGSEERKLWFQEYSRFKKEIAKPLLEQDLASFSAEFQTVYQRKILPLLMASSRAAASNLDKDSLWYDMACHPEAYFYAMYLLSRMHDEDDDDDTPSDQGPWFAVFPTRTSYIPCYITLEHRILLVTVLQQPYKGFNSDEEKQMWWAEYFRIDARPFHAQQRHLEDKAYTFEGTMYTDGIGVSIVKQKQKRKHRQKGTKNKTEQEKEAEKQPREEKAKAVKAKPKTTRKRKRETEATEAEEGEVWPYITAWSSEMLQTISQGKCVLIDPNRRDLLYAMHEHSTPASPKILRYTWNRQQKEMDTRGHRRLRAKLDTTLHAENATLKLAIDEHANTTLAKSCDFQQFTHYARSRCALVYLQNLSTHYEQLIFRKLKWTAYKKIKQCEWRMIRLFQSKFGNDAILVFGDHSRGHMSYQAPVRGKSLHEVLRKQSGFQCALIDEFRTSSYCADCESRVETFMLRSSARPWRRHLPARKIHGLLRCTGHCLDPELQQQRQRIWNRDLLAVLNFRRILVSLRTTGVLPVILQRRRPSETETEDDLEEPNNILTNSEFRPI